MKNQPVEDPKLRKAKLPDPAETEEVAVYEDAVISKAFRWSAVILAVLVAAAGVVWFLATRQPKAAPVRMTELSAPQVRQVARSQVPDAPFTELTAAAGIQFVHNNGAFGGKLLPETMGGGVAFFDFDNDGSPDLLFINSTYWPDHIPDGKEPTTLALYRNDGRGNFTDVTAGSGLDVSLYGMGVAVGDYDNDGWVDVFVTAVGENRLFRNLGNGTFEDVTARSGLAGDSEEWSTSAAWVDIDNDGLLDLFVCNYVRWSPEIDTEVGYKLVGFGRAYGQPMNFQGTFPYLYRNNGDGTFTDISSTSGVQIKNPATGVPVAKSLGIAPVDLDGDGWIDLIVANDTVQNFVFHNQRDGTFKEVGALSGVAFDSYGNTRGAMGIDTGRFRNDDATGIVIGNFANEMTALYVSQGAPMVFADEAITEGIGPASRLQLKFGIFFFDYDLDGRMDVLTANGHLEEEIHKLQQSQQYAQSAQLFWNAGSASGPSFIPVTSAQSGSDLFKPIVGRGSAFADIDGDGDLDAILIQIGGPPLLLRNDQSLGHNWLRLNLQGSASNRDAIGATVNVRIGGETLSRQVMPTRGYLSQSERTLTFGLGHASRIDAIEIVWPGGQIQQVSPSEIPLNAVTLVQEPVREALAQAP